MENNMKKRLLIALCFLLEGGCAPLNIPFMPPSGGLVTAFSAPLSTEMNGVTLTEDSIKEEQAFSFFWIPVLLPPIAVSDGNTHPKTQEFIDTFQFSADCILLLRCGITAKNETEGREHFPALSSVYR